MPVHQDNLKKRKILGKYHTSFHALNNMDWDIDKFEDFVEDLFKDELSNHSKFYGYGFSNGYHGPGDTYNCFWIETPGHVEEILPKDKLLFAKITCNMHLKAQEMA